MAKKKQKKGLVTRKTVDSTEMVELGQSLLLKPPDVDGRFVKVAPRLKSSERASFDGPAIKKSLLESGAKAVLLAPVIVPDAKRVTAEKVAEATNDREAVDAWFAEQHSDPEVMRDAKELILGFMDEEEM